MIIRSFVFPLQLRTSRFHLHLEKAAAVLFVLSIQIAPGMKFSVEGVDEALKSVLLRMLFVSKQTSNS